MVAQDSVGCLIDRDKLIQHGVNEISVIEPQPLLNMSSQEEVKQIDEMEETSKYSFIKEDSTNNQYARV